jgi:spore coat protein H
MERFGHCRGLIGALSFAAVVLVPGTACQANPGKESDAFFASKEVIRIAIDLEKPEIESLRKEPRTYVKASLKVNDRTVYKNVGLHIKGSAGSLRGIADKPGLTLNMDKFGEVQTFHGMDKWHLANSVQDSTYVTELICGAMYRAEGVPASRIGHALVTINGKMHGLYYVKEGYDRHFRKRHFEDPHGNLYDGGFIRDLDKPLQLLSGSADVKNQADLAALLAAAAEKDPTERFHQLQKRLDMDKFITYLCLQVLTWDVDGYPIYQNNYRIYHEPKKDKIIFFPSGMDQMFMDPKGSIFPAFRGKIARAVINTPAGRERYLKRMDQIVKKLDVNAMMSQLGELQEKLQPALASVDAKAARDYPKKIQRLMEAIKTRVKSVEAQLALAKK